MVVAHRVDHLRQAMQRLRAKNNVNVMGALANQFAFLGGDTAADADNHAGFFLFQ